MAHSPSSEESDHERYEISCPVTLMVRVRGKRHVLFHGWACEIGVGSARVRLEQPLPEGLPVVMDVHFTGPNEQTTVRFFGTVTAATKGPDREVTVSFEKRGRFLRGQLPQLLGPPPTRRIQ